MSVIKKCCLELSLHVILKLASNRRGSMWDIKQRVRGAFFVSPESSRYMHTWHLSYTFFSCTTNAIFFTAVILYRWGVGCWWVDGILLLLYSYIIIIPDVVQGGFAATAKAEQLQPTSAASASLVLWVSSRWFGCCWCDTCIFHVCSCYYYSYDNYCGTSCTF